MKQNTALIELSARPGRPPQKGKNMYDSKLCDQMIIRKAQKPSFAVRLKSIVSFVVIWSLWALSFYLITKDLGSLIAHPIVHHWTLSEILKATLAFTLLLLVVLQIWDLYVCRMTKRRRQNLLGQQDLRGNE